MPFSRIPRSEEPLKAISPQNHGKWPRARLSQGLAGPLIRVAAPAVGPCPVEGATQRPSYSIPLSQFLDLGVQFANFI